MQRCKVFIDGSWLWHSMMSYNSDHSHRYNIGALPSHLVAALGENHTYVGTILCASIPKNVDPQDLPQVDKRFKFFKLLKDKYNFELDLYEIDFQGRRLRKQDRYFSDYWVPKEKCVDIATISKLFYHQGSYECAIVVTGDRDFIPAFKTLLLMGKTVYIGSFRATCSTELSTTFKTIWLNDILPNLILS